LSSVSNGGSSRRHGENLLLAVPSLRPPKASSSHATTCHQLVRRAVRPLCAMMSGLPSSPQPHSCIPHDTGSLATLTSSSPLHSAHTVRAEKYTNSRLWLPRHSRQRHPPSAAKSGCCVPLAQRGRALRVGACPQMTPNLGKGGDVRASWRRRSPVCLPTKNRHSLPIFPGPASLCTNNLGRAPARGIPIQTPWLPLFLPAPPKASLLAAT
jgi:hypothetical protein